MLGKKKVIQRFEKLSNVLKEVHTASEWKLATNGALQMLWYMDAISDDEYEEMQNNLKKEYFKMKESEENDRLADD